MVGKQLQYVVCNWKVLENVVVSIVDHKVKNPFWEWSILRCLSFGNCLLLEDYQEKMGADIVFALDTLIEHGGLSINEISSALKLMEIVTTAECVMTLEEQNHLWKDLVQCVADLDPRSLANLEQNRDTFRIRLKIKVCMYKQNRFMNPCQLYYSSLFS